MDIVRGAAVERSGAPHRSFEASGAPPAGGGGLRLRTDACRGNTHFIPGDKAILGTHPAAVHTDLTAPENSIQPAFWKSGKLAAEKIVDALAGQVVVNTDLANPGVGGALSSLSGGIHK